MQAALDKQAAQMQAHKDKLAAEKEAHKKYLADLAAKQEAEQKSAHEAAELAHKQAIAARKAQAERQEALHAKLMQERKSSFAAQYSHVWISGAPGLSMATVTIPDRGTVDELLLQLYKQNTIADAWHQKSTDSTVSRTVLTEHHMTTNDGEQKLMMLTSDARIPDLLATTEEILKTKEFDMVFTSPRTGNNKYIEWAQTQTVPVGTAPRAVETSPDASIQDMAERDPLVPRAETQVAE